MTVHKTERCCCGEQHVVEFDGPFVEDILYLRLHDLAPIEICQGCGRSFAEMHANDVLWDEEPYEDPYGVKCGGIRMGGERQ